MKIEFAPPFIDESVIQEVTDSLRSGWITTGPKVRDLEGKVSELAKIKHVACVNSWTSGAQLVLKWFGVGKGDEVILPAYTYSATALVVLHCGATPVLADVLEDFTIDPESIKNKITSKTKLIFSVDFAGLPCNYDEINALVKEKEILEKFTPENDVQKQLNRILVVSDAAHSIGAKYKDLPASNAADITIYSFHAVKNVTTAEGGAICINLPSSFDNEEVFKWMKLNSLNGQTKDAFAKSQAGNWRYDIISDGLKINMPDICAAIGLAQIKVYESDLLPKRQLIFDWYNTAFQKYDWAILPTSKKGLKTSSCHLFALRIKGISEIQRDLIIDEVSKTGVSVNVHFIPLPLLTLFKEKGYKMEDYPMAYNNFSKEISLPIYPQLSKEKVEYICQTIVSAVQMVKGNSVESRI